VKRSGRDEPMWVVIHTYMEPMLEISLYLYFYLKLAKMLCFFSLSLIFFLQQNRRTRGWNRFCPEAGGGEKQIMYTHASKHKNDKIKRNK
jgi:hypothetical protein